jgi:two-component system, OmpR family, response regulator
LHDFHSFCMLLRVVDALLETAATAKSEGDSRPHGETEKANGNVRALIADDDVDTTLDVVRILKAVGFDCTHTSDGGEALRYGSEQSFSLIVLDLLLRRHNGYRVVRDLRARRVNAPILVLTGKQGHFDEVEALETGADDFLRKPCEPSVLAARATGLLRRPAVFGNHVLGVGDYRFDPMRRTCRRADGSPVTLTRTESRMLEVLARAEGAVASREHLVSEVWGADFDGNGNSVDIYVGYLCKKLGRDVVLTFRGRGFAIG